MGWGPPSPLVAIGCLSFLGVHPFHQLTLSAATSLPTPPAAFPFPSWWQFHPGVKNLELILTPLFLSSSTSSWLAQLFSRPSIQIQDLTISPSPTPQHLVCAGVIVHLDCWNSLLVTCFCLIPYS